MVARQAHANRMAALGSLMRGLAHELNNPLTCVLANLDLLAGELDQLDLPAATRADLAELAADAATSAGVVATMIDDVRRVARHRPAARDADLGDAVRTACAVTAGSLRPRARVRLELTACPPVSASPDHLVQILVNLLTNAAQAIPDGAQDAHHIVVRTRVTGDAVVLEVEDDGSGVDPADLPRVFEPFYSTRAPDHASGLGLPTCRALLRGGGGDIALHPRESGGTVARVRLPIATSS